KRSKTMQNAAYAPNIIKTHFKITKVVDGDGLYAEDMFGHNEIEIRFLGIDAPEIKRSRKLKQDERETHLPGELLMELGRASKQFLSLLAPVGTSITLLMEKQHSYDVYGRTLAYVLLPDGSCLNEQMIIEGYAKAYSKYYCNQLPSYQKKNVEAKQEKRGLYSAVNSF
ncbi:MAG TPA: thermonuclease family protein, partial [Flavisolibacter sp.]|nr:thermonuclease family protein [Flavisolibacter sp.]